MGKKLTGIIYRYSDGSVEYVDSVSEISATSVISLRWFNTALTKLKKYWKGHNW
tara:strand:+ start:5280 stop:5441 length:162 start_codon:yes stop_codon:yes gene_type:complete